ncbi:MAG: hypothetical protein HQ594_03895, partial [Candidatus Omnitrophica bacterium]|nr:hypothetical protein [Candidatus Omnitrophota bacterium]
HRGQTLTVTPYDGTNKESGFKAFDGKELVAYFNAKTGKKWVKQKKGETRKVSYNGMISWYGQTYSAGIYHRGQTLTVTPYDGTNKESGFKAFDGKELVAYFNAKTGEKWIKPKEKEIRKVSRNGTISWHGQTCLVGPHRRGQTLTLTPFDGTNNKSGFKAFDGEELVAWHNFKTEEKWISEKTKDRDHLAIEAATTEEEHEKMSPSPPKHKKILYLPSYAEETIRAIEETDADIAEVARMLGLSRTAVRYRIKQIRKIAASVGDQVTLDRIDKALKSSSTKSVLDEEGSVPLAGSVILGGIAMLGLVLFYNYHEISAFLQETNWMSYINTAMFSVGVLAMVWHGKYKKGEEEKKAGEEGVLYEVINMEIHLLLNMLEDKSSLIAMDVEQLRDNISERYGISTGLIELRNLLSSPAFDNYLEQSGLECVWEDSARSTLMVLRMEPDMEPEVSKKPIKPKEKGTRKVSHNGTISWNSQNYFISIHLRYQTLRVEPYDGTNNKSGFKAFDGKELVAWQNFETNEKWTKPADVVLPPYAEETIKELEKIDTSMRKVAKKLGTSLSNVVRKIKQIRKMAVLIGDQATLDRIDKAFRARAEKKEVLAKKRIKAIKKAGGDRAEAARKLGMLRDALYHWINYTIENGNPDTVKKLKEALDPETADGSNAKPILDEDGSVPLVRSVILGGIAMLGLILFYNNYPAISTFFQETNWLPYIGTAMFPFGALATAWSRKGSEDEKTEPSRETSLMSHLTSEKKVTIDIGLDQLDRLTDRGLIHTIATEALQRRGIQLEVEDKFPEKCQLFVKIKKEGGDGDVILRISVLRNHEYLGENIMRLDQIVLPDPFPLGRRIMPLVYRWVATEESLVDKYGGWRIFCPQTPLKSAKAWERSGFFQAEPLSFDKPQSSYALHGIFPTWGKTRDSDRFSSAEKSGATETVKPKAKKTEPSPDTTHDDKRDSAIAIGEYYDDGETNYWMDTYSWHPVTGVFGVSSTTDLLKICERFLIDKPDARVLDLGHGTGKAAAIFSLYSHYVKGKEMRANLHDQAVTCISDFGDEGMLDPSSIHLECGDFFKEDFSQYDLIYQYFPFDRWEEDTHRLRGKEMIRRLDEKLARELKPGAVFVLNHAGEPEDLDGKFPSLERIELPRATGDDEVDFSTNIVVFRVKEKTVEETPATAGDRSGLQPGTGASVASGTSPSEEMQGLDVSGVPIIKYPDQMFIRESDSQEVSASNTIAIVETGIVTKYAPTPIAARVFRTRYGKLGVEFGRLSRDRNKFETIPAYEYIQYLERTSLASGKSSLERSILDDPLVRTLQRKAMARESAKSEKISVTPISDSLVIDQHMGEDDVFAKILREISNFGPQAKPSAATIERRQLLDSAHPEIIAAIRTYFEEQYPDEDFSSLKIIITAGGSTQTGVAQDGSDLDLYFLVDDSELREEFQFKPSAKPAVVRKAREIISEMIDKQNLTGIRKHHPTNIVGRKTWFLRDIIRNPKNRINTREIANAFLVSCGPVESIRRKLLHAIMSLDEPYKKWAAIQKKWRTYVNHQHVGRLDPEYVPRDGLSLDLPVLETMLKIYNIATPAAPDKLVTQESVAEPETKLPPEGGGRSDLTEYAQDTATKAEDLVLYVKKNMPFPDTVETIVDALWMDPADMADPTQLAQGDLAKLMEFGRFLEESNVAEPLKQAFRERNTELSAAREPARDEGEDEIPAAIKPGPTSSTASVALELQEFIEKYSFGANKLGDGTVYQATPYPAIITAFDELEKLYGGKGSLHGKHLLDFGTGDLRVALIAANLYGMKVTAVENDKETCFRALQNYQKAWQRGFAENIEFINEPIDAFNLDWRKFDAVFFFYTHSEYDGGRYIRDGLQRKAKELKDNGV